MPLTISLCCYFAAILQTIGKITFLIAIRAVRRNLKPEPQLLSASGWAYEVGALKKGLKKTETPLKKDRNPLKTGSKIRWDDWDDKGLLGFVDALNETASKGLPHRHSQRLIGVGVQVLKVIFEVMLKRLFKGYFWDYVKAVVWMLFLRLS